MLKRDELLSFLSDRSGIIPVIPQATYCFADLVGISVRDALGNAELMSRCLLEGYRRFDLDGIYCGWESSFNLMAFSLGSEVHLDHDGVPSVKEPIVFSGEDLDRLGKIDPMEDPSLRAQVELVRMIRAEVGERCALFSYFPAPFTVAGLLFGNDNLLMKILLDPGMVKEAIHALLPPIRSYLEAKAGAGLDVVTFADPLASTDIISPEMFDEFVAFSLEELSRFALDLGCLPSIHICGKTVPIMKRIVDCGPRLIEADYANDLEEVFRVVKGRACVMGNLEPSGLLKMGTPEQVYQESKRCMESAKSEDAWFVLSSGCEVPSGTPAANLEAMFRARDDFCKGN